MPTQDEITTVVIHPAIGIARVGNSPNQYFFGPEIPGPHPVDPGNFRDAEGRIKRQAARFRIFGLNAQGEIVREITANEAEISWTVHVANKKAAWYEFKQALDIPASRGELPGVPAIACNRRNPFFTGIGRRQLVIDPGPRTIGGRNVNSDGLQAQFAFDNGKFFKKSVYLGELRTDEQGNLIVLGGRGLSAARAGEPLLGFANNNGWHDDTADGPVEALVRINGREFQAIGAWVVIGPPNYAPGIPAIVTGYDLLFEVATRLDPNLRPARPTFFQHIYPLLQRFPLNQWVNGGFARDFGWGSMGDFSQAALLARLQDPSEANRPFRQALFARFRSPTYKTKQPDAWPHFYGDAVTFHVNTRDPREWMAVLETQYDWLAKWAAGNFDLDAPPLIKPWEAMTPAERARGLDRAALDETTGGPFHPGCEFTWPLRQAIMYAAPLRFKRRTKAEPDWGPQLTSFTALKKGGPLDGSGPGDLTRWMAVPWQTDTASCLSAYPFGAYFRDYIPTFWPARVPNDVLTEENYQIVLDTNRSQAERERAFGLAARRKWLRGIAYTTTLPARMSNNRQAMASFVRDWDKVGIVMQRSGPVGNATFPPQVWVETGRHLALPRDIESARALQPASQTESQPGAQPESDGEEAPWWEEAPINLR